ncbi:MAG TPA: hypothetical protein VJB90_03955 [Candidatus Nanoarchaeia archaeon]|nr:hypothetical protein [Candidatus Nanoarchaeia archaeon]
MTENITFRTQLIGSVTDFAEACGIGPLLRPAILVELIVTLSKYREEGSKLFPDVYLCNDIEEALKLIPDHDILHIGTTGITEDAIKEILKKCAPLANGGWCIFIEGDVKKLNYGMFRGPLNPLAIPIDETLLSTGATVKVVKVYQVAEDCVEIRSYVGGLHRIYFSNQKDTSPSPMQYLGNLVDTICSKVPMETRESVANFIREALRNALLRAHGSLIVVCKSAKIPKLLSDGVHLAQPIDFAKQVEAVLDKEALPSSLSPGLSLLIGMLNSDGIVVFSNDGKLLGYNCFISLPTKKVVSAQGGARRRAFDALCDRIGKGLQAVFIQSQDGGTDFRRVKND